MNKRMTTTGRRLCCILTGLGLGVCLSIDAGARSRGEYFWNNDPGIGRGKALNEEATSDGFSTFTLDAGEMTTGLNMLGLRARENGRWSHTQYHFVMLPSVPTVSWSGEYFWNDDPGVGKATKLPARGTDGGYLSLDIDASTLQTGTVNVLGLRMNAGGSWSQTQTYIVMVPADPASAQWSAEYFWDTDPGIGKATPLAIAPGTNGAVSFELPTAALAPGEHTLGVRTCAGRAWSQTSLSTVVVPYDRNADVIGAEYFWGADPGFGKGTPISLTAGAEVTVDNLAIDFPKEQAAEYVLNFRARTAYGWGQTITKVLPHLYVEAIAINSPKDWIEPGETMTLTPVLTPEDAFISAVTWSSDNSSVATVDARGNVKGIGEGSATITATSTDGTNISGKKTIRVLKAVKSLTLSASELTLEISRQATLTATATPANATETGVIWSIDDATVAKVSANGTVTALKAGTATITATAADQCGATAQCALTVTLLRGDADGSGTLAVNDVVLTARGVVDDVDKKLVMEAADMNADGRLTVGDLTGVVDAVMGWKAPAAAIRHRIASTHDDVMDITVGSNATIGVGFNEMSGYCGVQFDLVTPEGLEVDGITAPDGFATALRSIGNGRYRAMAYGTEPLLGVSVGLKASPALASGSYELTLTNAFASDRDGNLYALCNADATVAYSPQSGLSGPEADGITIRTEGKRVIIESPTDTIVTVTDMQGIARRIEVRRGRTEFTLATPGVYLINCHKIIIR